MTARLPNFSRAVDGWKTLIVAGERFGMCNERHAAIARFLFSQVASVVDWQAALWWVVQRDTYRREQDLELLRHTSADIATAERKGILRIALFFGVASRGESVKTSSALPHQGVTIDSP